MAFGISKTHGVPKRNGIKRRVGIQVPTLLFYPYYWKYNGGAGEGLFCALGFEPWASPATAACGGNREQGMAQRSAAYGFSATQFDNRLQVDYLFGGDRKMFSSQKRASTPRGGRAPYGNSDRSFGYRKRQGLWGRVNKREAVPLFESASALAKQKAPSFRMVLSLCV